MTRSLNYNWIPLPDEVKGKLFLMQYPGRASDGKIDAELMRRDLSLVQELGANRIVTLTPVAERIFIAGEALPQVCEALDLLWQEFPIQDFSVPSPEQQALLAGLLDELVGTLQLGKTIAIHCYGGIGRSGTLAGMILGKLGMSGDQAIDHVRAHRKGAIETLEQEALVRKWGTAQLAIG